VTTLLIALGALIAGGGAVGLIGHARLQRERAAHKHIWSPWQDCDVKDGLVMVAGQKRECLDCGLKETRRVTL